MRLSPLVCLFFISTSIAHGARPPFPQPEDSEDTAEVVDCTQEYISCVLSDAFKSGGDLEIMRKEEPRGHPSKTKTVQPLLPFDIMRKEEPRGRHPSKTVQPLPPLE